MRNLRIAMVTAVAIMSGPALAQSSLPSRLVAPSYQPGNITISKPLDVGQFAGASVPAGAEKLRVKAGRIILENDPGLLPAAREALVAALSNKSVTVADIFSAARAFERAHADSGYVLLRVVIPPQKLVDGGAVRLKIVNGFLETVDVSALSERVRDPVRARLEPLVGKEGVTRAEIERAVLLAGDLAGLNLRSTLAPGAQPGGTKILLDGQHELLSGGLSIDNRANSRLGPWLFNANAAINSGLGQGEQIYFAWAGSPSDPITAHARLRTFALGALVPVGVTGFTLSPEVTWSQSNPRPETGSPPSTNEYLRFALRGSYPIIRGVDTNLTARLAVERIEQKVTLSVSGSDKLDRYMVGRFNLEGQENFSFGTLSQALSVSQGLGGRDADDARAAGVGLSRDNTKPEFTKAGLALQARLAAQDVALALTFRSQISFNQALFASEQLGLDGSDALSGYAAGTIAVDQGATLRGELSPEEPWLVAPRVGVSPYLFSAYGLGNIRHATTQENAFQRATTFGAGLRTGVGDFIPGVSGVTFQLEVARSIANPSLSDARGYRISSGLSLRF